MSRLHEEWSRPAQWEQPAQACAWTSSSSGGAAASAQPTPAASSWARGRNPMVFKGGPSTGKGHFVDAGRCPEPLASLVFTCRVQVQKKQGYSRLFDLGNGPDRDNVWLGFAGPGEEDHLVFEVVSLRGGGGGQVLKTRTRGHPLSLNVWYDVRCELEKLNKTQSRARVWVDDKLTVDCPVQAPTEVPRTGCYIGKSNYPADELLTGQMTSVSLAVNGKEKYAWSA